jgi:lipoprotein signal peptidase
MQTEGRAPLTGQEPSDQPNPQPNPQLNEQPNEQSPGSTPAEPRHRRVGLFAVVAVAVVGVDQVSKLLIVAHMAGRAPIKLLGGLLTITYTRNPGAAFSLGTGFTVLFTAVAATVVVVIIRSARRLYSIAWAVAFGGLLGGAVGNLVDRMLRAPGPGRGHVVDWIQLPHFAVFNLADSAISCSAVGMVLLTVLGRDMDGSRAKRPAQTGPAGLETTQPASPDP